jgi:PIN domain nuclease of toxin-antitoxin system
MSDKKDEDKAQERDIVTKDMVEDARAELVSAQSFYESCIAARKTAVSETEKARSTLGSLEALLQQTIILEGEAKRRVLEFKDRYLALVLAQSKELDS